MEQIPEFLSRSNSYLVRIRGHGILPSGAIGAIKQKRYWLKTNLQHGGINIHTKSTNFEDLLVKCLAVRGAWKRGGLVMQVQLTLGDGSGNVCLLNLFAIDDSEVTKEVPAQVIPVLVEKDPKGYTDRTEDVGASATYEGTNKKDGM